MPEPATIHDPHYSDVADTLRLGYALRNGFVVFTMALCLLLRGARILEFPLAPFFAVLLAELGINQWWLRGIRWIRTADGLRHYALVQIVFDLVAVSLAIYVAGGLLVFFINLAYMFLVLWAGFFLSVRACYITAFGSAAAYGAVLWTQYLDGYRPFMTFPAESPIPWALIYLAAGLGHTAALLLIAYFGAKAAQLLVAGQHATQLSVSLKSDLDQTIRRLVRSEKLAATGELAAGMAHEIYNPLTAIAGLAESSLLQHGTLPPKTRGTLQTIRAQAERAGAVVRRLLRFAKPAHLQLAPCHLNGVITDALGMIRYKTDLQRITIETDLDQHLPVLRGDHIQLQEVCANLLLNAVQAMPKGGRLRVTSRAVSPNTLELCIEDSGCGIPASHLARIFDPFFTTKPEGTGLGLSVSHSIIQQHGGAIDVRSRPGEGATFTIRLPVDLRQAGPSTGEPATIVDLARSMASPTILVVDDDEVVCRMLAQFLVDYGYQVTTAQNGQSAIAMAAQEPPDLILLDLRMPGMDGVECLRHLKSQRAEVPVVVVTAIDDEAVAARCATLGAAHYLVKPFHLESLRKTIEACLQKPGNARTGSG